MLLILDGWGISSIKENNAIYLANTPNFDHLIQNYPNSQLYTHGEYVGLPENQMGNSEVGHMTIGAGRIIQQDLVKIKSELQDIHNNEAFVDFASDIKKCHILGICSDGGVHGHVAHIHQLISIFKKLQIEVAIHAFLDGRDTHPENSLEFVENMENIATISGRYYAMDRDNRWKRTQLAFDAIYHGQGLRSSSVINAIMACYDIGITDEFIAPHVIRQHLKIDSQDGILFANFRQDRIRQLCHLIKQHHTGRVLTMSDYGDISIPSIIRPAKIRNTLGAILAQNNKKQIRIAETEKYPHVTYFFNAGIEQKFDREERVMIPSPQVATYDLKPEMSAKEVKNAALDAIKKHFDFMLVNFANPDMVGHTGKLNETIQAVEIADQYLGEIYKKCINNNITLMITSDHGNAESMIQDKSPHTSHTINQVPFIIADKSYTIRDGSLENIAPTILNIMKLDIPIEMQQQDLIVSTNSEIH